MGNGRASPRDRVEKRLALRTRGGVEMAIR